MSSFPCVWCQRWRLQCGKGVGGSLRFTECECGSLNGDARPMKGDDVSIPSNLLVNVGVLALEGVNFSPCGPPFLSNFCRLA
jgi:hypothetical protein